MPAASTAAQKDLVGHDIDCGLPWYGSMPRNADHSAPRQTNASVE